MNVDQDTIIPVEIFESDSLEIHRAVDFMFQSRTFQIRCKKIILDGEVCFDELQQLRQRILELESKVKVLENQ